LVRKIKFLKSFFLKRENLKSPFFGFLFVVQFNTDRNFILYFNRIFCL